MVSLFEISQVWAASHSFLLAPDEVQQQFIFCAHKSKQKIYLCGSRRPRVLEQVPQVFPAPANKGLAKVFDLLPLDLALFLGLLHVNLLDTDLNCGVEFDGATGFQG